MAVLASASLPHHGAHPPANTEAAGENWRKRKREEVWWGCLAGLKSPILSLFLILLRYLQPLPPQRITSPNSPGRVGGHHEHIFRVLASSADTEAWRKLFVFAVRTDGRQKSTTVPDVLTQELRCDVLSRLESDGRDVQTVSYVIRGGGLFQ